jgi:spore germination cell wall hydrolase CwlJ-like protein
MSDKIKFLRIVAGILVLVVGLFLTNTEERYFLFGSTPEPVAEVAEVVKVAKAVDPKQLACMAKNIYYEAKGEPFNGQAAVARVVMNRVSHGFGSNPCNVIYQATYVEKENEYGDMYKAKLCQFSWVCDNKGEPNKNSQSYLQAKEIAYDVMAYNAYEDVVPKSTLFFHNLSAQPSWPYQQVKKIGNHIFYSKEKRKQKVKTKLEDA